MSHERKTRQELRQGLHQFLMQLYQSYLTSHSEEEAKQLVADIIREQYELFSGVSFTTEVVTEIIESKSNELQVLLEEEKVYDRQMFYAEKIDVLAEAIQILAK